MEGKIAQVRHIDGKRYSLEQVVSNKSDAVKYAKELKAFYGLTRVIKTSVGYAIYVRKSK